MQIDPSIFKAYDIRGIFPEQLNEEVACAVGRAFATFLQVDSAVVGRDMRISSPRIFAALAQGLAEQGADVIDIGMVSTDQYYYACARLEKAGLMVTASHNPPQYNGFKMVRRMPYLLSGDDGIHDLRRIVEEESFLVPPRTGERIRKDLSAEFVRCILGLIDVTELKPLKVVVDTGNGMVGPILQRVFEHLPVELTGMYLEPDGRVPNHGLDPLQPQNREELQHRVKSTGADVGFAFDGDGDRFFAIDDRGEFVPGDFLTALMGCYLLEKYPGARIIHDVRASWAVADLIGENGGVALMERVGHAFMKSRMVQEKAAFGGEVTGHYYFRSFFNADSGLVPSLVLLEMLSRRGRKLSELLAPLESRYFISGEINSSVEDPQVKIRALAALYGDGGIEWVDGLSVSYDDWHFNVRPSNTEPLLRLNLEAMNKGLMEEKREEVLAIIRS